MSFLQNWEDFFKNSSNPRKKNMKYQQHPSRPPLLIFPHHRRRRHHPTLRTRRFNTAATAAGFPFSGSSCLPSSPQPGSIWAGRPSVTPKRYSVSSSQTLSSRCRPESGSRLHLYPRRRLNSTTSSSSRSVRVRIQA